MNILKHRSTHSDRLERWIGKEQLENISTQAKGWYGNPIPLANTPGKIYVTGSGDFVGPLKGGYYSTLACYAWDKCKTVVKKAAQKSQGQLNTGFSSLSDLIAEATANGKMQQMWFSKVGTGNISAGNYSLWSNGTTPGIGVTPSARPGGSVPTNTTVGALGQVDPAGADTLHLTTMQSLGTTAPNCLILFDRTFHASAISHTIATAQSVTGVPTRYATTTSPGVFAFLETTTAVGTTPQNVTMTYTDETGATGLVATALAITISSSIGRIPHAQFFIPLLAGDYGVRAVTNLTFSAANTTGVSNIVQGKMYAMIPQPVSNSMVVMDGINSAFNMSQILTGACISLLEMKGVGAATIYTGTITMVSG